MRYAAGQVWTYHHRPGEDASRVTVLHVDDEPHYGVIVHVAVSDVAIRTPRMPDGLIKTLGHLPISEQAMDWSVAELVETLPEPPDCSDGYTTWREAFDLGQAGVFTVPLGQLVGHLEESMNGIE